MENMSVTKLRLRFKNIIGNLLYIIAVFLIIAWTIGVIEYNTGGIIHGLMIIAVIAILIKFFRDEGFIKSYGKIK
jgi:predicted ferric reductase